MALSDVDNGSFLLWHIYFYKICSSLTVDRLANIGTLDGFSFDSEDESDKVAKAIPHRTDQNDGIDGQVNGKAKGKAKKTSVCIWTTFIKMRLC